MSRYYLKKCRDGNRSTAKSIEQPTMFIVFSITATTAVVGGHLKPTLQVFLGFSLSHSQRVTVK